MICEESFTSEHINSVVNQKIHTPGLVMKSIYALGLLEALVRVNMPFIFKGGTSLMLLSDRPRRLSTDIDITVEPGTDVDAYLELASKIFPFTRMEEDPRGARNGIVKRHFSFYYQTNDKYNTNIILDILYEKFHYTEVEYREIKSDLLITIEPYLKVRMPSANCLLADKLTAFAPHTCGIVFGINKNVNIMKQFFDIGTLLDMFTDFEQVRTNYFETVQREINYSDNDCTPEDCLWDVIKSATCLASNGKILPEDYKICIAAMERLMTHVYEKRSYINGANAYTISVRVIYAAACLLTGNTYKHLTEDDLTGIGDFNHIKMTIPIFKCMHPLKFASPISFGYIVLADRMLATQDWSKHV